MTIDATTRRLGATFVVVSAVTLLLAGLLAIPRTRLSPNSTPRPVDFDEPTGLPVPAPSRSTP
jgi:hypothetical protein